MKCDLERWYLIGWLSCSMVNQCEHPRSSFQVDREVYLYTLCVFYAGMFTHAVPELCVPYHLSLWFIGGSVIGLSALVNKGTHAYLIDYSPLLSLVTLAASLAFVPPTCRSSVPGSD